MLMETIVPLMVIIPLGAAFTVAILSNLKVVSRLARIIAPLAIAVNLTLSIWICVYSYYYGDATVWAGRWDGIAGRPIGIELVCDGFARLMLVTINLVAFAAIIFSTAYMERFTTIWLYDSLFLLMTGAMNGVVLSGDLFNMYVFIEIAAISSYGLVAFGTEREELEAAFKYLTLGVIGSTFILIGVTVLYSLTGQLNMSRVARIISLRGISQSPAVILAAASLIGGLSLKAAMVPFHAWLPDAHPSAPAPISAMLSGVLIKAAGVYAVVRIIFNVLGINPYYANVLIALGALSMVIGVFLAIGQWDFKRLLAYHSISQMGYVVMSIGVAAAVVARGGSMMAASLCMLGGLFHMFNHAAFKSLLFLSSGSIEQATGTRHLKKMGGLARRMPLTSFCCRVGALSIAGVPPFNGFFSKLIIIIGLVVAGYPILAALAVLVALMTLLSFIKVQRYALEGPVSEQTSSVRESSWQMGLGMVILAVVCVLAGLALIPLKQYLFDPAGNALLNKAASMKNLLVEAVK